MMRDGDQKTIRVVVVEDHPMFREGLVALLQDLDGVEVVGQAASGDEAVDLVQAVTPDLCLMDLQLPGISGVEATNRIVRMCPGTAVLVLTMLEDDPTILAAVRAGARGYLLKEATSEEIVRSLWAVANGQVVFGGLAASRVLAALAAADARRPFPEITLREVEVLSLIARGLTNSAIAERLYLSEKTVRNHVSNVFTKLGVTDRAAAVARARDAGLGPGPT